MQRFMHDVNRIKNMIKIETEKIRKEHVIDVACGDFETVAKIEAQVNMVGIQDHEQRREEIRNSNLEEVNIMSTY
jgi:hypothetical protein